MQAFLLQSFLKVIDLKPSAIYNVNIKITYLKYFHKNCTFFESLQPSPVLLENGVISQDNIIQDVALHVYNHLPYLKNT